MTKKKKASSFGIDYARGVGIGTAGDRHFAAAAARKSNRDGDGVQTNDLRGGTTHRITADPYRDPAGEAPPSSSGTSIFDPVLCELAYRWFCPPGGLILDPFAGGSVRGIVAGRLGRRYLGIELRGEQVTANEAQAHIAGDLRPEWVEGDSREIADLVGDTEADFIFSCPPYWNLEVYSDDPRDLSTLPREKFFAAQAEIIKAAVDRLKPNRFAAWVTGDVRDKDGCYVNLPGRTIEAFEAAGAKYYNEAILVTAAGSLPIRAGKQFATTRKLGKTHQNFYVFVKGDPRKATEAVGEVEFGDLGEADTDAAAAVALGLQAFGEPL